MRKIIYLLLFPLLSFGQSQLDRFEDYIKHKKFDVAEIKLTVYLEQHPEDFDALRYFLDK